MRKGEKRLFLGVLMILGIALALLVSQWVQGGDTPKVYHVSVLQDGMDSDYWKNFRAGLNQAALEHNVDLRIITRYDGESSQAEVLRREWEGQADGVVIIPADSAALSAALDEAPANLAVTVMGARMETKGVDGYIAPDYDKMGRELADEVAKAGGTCMLFVSPDAQDSALQIANGLEQELAGRGIPCARRQVESAELLAVPREGSLVAVEPVMVETLCQLPGVSGRVYGIGASSRLLRYLEDEVLAALVVQSDYDAGYLALTHLVEQLSRGKTRDEELESYVATAETMLKEPMISILFATY